MNARETRVDLGTLLAGLGALLLLISLFLDWYGPESGDLGITAWEVFELLDVVLAAVALAVLYAVALSFSPGARWPAMPTSGARVAGIVALVLVVVSLIDEPPLVRLGAPESQPEVGAWLALAGAVLMTLGGLLGRVRVSFVRADDRATEPDSRIYDTDTETRPLP